MKVVIEDIRADIYIDGKSDEVMLTVEIDTDRMGEAARRAYNNESGIATWADGAIKAIIQDRALEG